MIPRAVAYSAGMLDYFFRGKLEITQDPADSRQIFIKNAGPEDISGTFAFYYDAADGERKLISESTFILRIAAGDQSEALPFISPPSTKPADQITVVFKGTMGQESQTAVAAKVANLKTTHGYYLLTSPIKTYPTLFELGNAVFPGATFTANQGNPWDFGALLEPGQYWSVSGTAPGNHSLNTFEVRASDYVPPVPGVITGYEVLVNLNGHYDYVRGSTLAEALAKANAYLAPLMPFHEIAEGASGFPRISATYCTVSIGNNGWYFGHFKPGYKMYLPYNPEPVDIPGVMMSTDLHLENPAYGIDLRAWTSALIHSVFYTAGTPESGHKNN